MDKQDRTRGEEFVQILIREYEDLLNDAKKAVIRYERLIKDYNYTPTQLDEEAWRASQHHKDVAHYEKVLAQLKGDDHESPTDGKFACINGM
jgi:hypothetical protein